jgi:hypothetical protein
LKHHLLAAACLAALAPLSAAAQSDGHVHTPLCNHQWSDHQGALSFATPLALPSAGRTTGMTFILNDLGGVGAGTVHPAYHGTLLRDAAAGATAPA